MRLELQGKGCIVTGAGWGIGRTTAELLCGEGAQVVVVDRDARGVETAVAECRALGGEAIPVVEDVTSPYAPKIIADACLQHFARIDVLVYNAGASPLDELDELDDEEWQRQWELNVLAPMRLTRAVIPTMARSGRGSIVNICSSSTCRPSSMNAAYSVTEAAELALTKVLAEEYADKGVRVNAVASGPVEKEPWINTGAPPHHAAKVEHCWRDEARQAAVGRVPLGRFGTVHEAASVVVLLCASDVAPSGAVWHLDGRHVAETLS